MTKKPERGITTGCKRPAMRLKNSIACTRHSKLLTVIAQVYEVSRNDVIFEII